MSSRLASVAAAMVIIATACSGDAGPLPAHEGDIPAIDGAGMEEVLASSDQPVVLNVWASWCIPCRSEAPLLRAAHEAVGSEVRFIGVDVADGQVQARAFLNEFGIEFENYFDPNRSVPASLGRSGVPLTFFFRPGGELSYAHAGVIDERSLALHIDELLAG
jgi:cytochrome c biogenesis protein CcmG/thiol:disulfide interchange protein DsbE